MSLVTGERLPWESRGGGRGAAFISDSKHEKGGDRETGGGGVVPLVR